MKVIVVTSEINPEEEEEKSYPGERKEEAVTPHPAVADKKQGVPINKRKAFKKVAKQKSRPRTRSKRDKRKGKMPGKK